MNKGFLARRIGVYTIGIFLVALGVSVSVKANLGVSPNSSVPKVLNDLFPRLTMGTWSIIVFGFFIFLQALILRRDFRITRLLQLVCTFLFGFFVDLANWLTDWLLAVPTFYPVQWIYMVCSMALMGLGLCLYMSPKYVILPMESLIVVISEKRGAVMHKVKMAVDSCMALTSLCLSIFGLGYLGSVREGTVVAAIGVGKFLGIYMKHLGPRLDKFIGMDKAVQTASQEGLGEPAAKEITEIASGSQKG